MKFIYGHIKLIKDSTNFVVKDTIQCRNLKKLPLQILVIFGSICHSLCLKNGMHPKGITVRLVIYFFKQK